MSSSHSVKDIFSDAIELPPEQRDEFVVRRCGDNTAVLAGVRALLAAVTAQPGFLRDPTIAPVADTWVGPVPESVGGWIGRYKLLQLIGEGGFGSVFMAEQMEPVRRRVAVKIIKLGMDTKAVIARFEAERQALAMMDHANIARVLDAGATDAGRPYFVMELVNGQPITRYCDKHNLTIRERLELFTQVCHAVQHAHQRGIIHRDLKPTNVLVSTQDDHAAVKVIDFGIAKATDHRLTAKTLFTEHRTMIGTPEYMSPEQAEGSLDIDTRTDVYSLGVLLYELLAGTTPFDPARLRSAAYGEIQRIIREIEPPKPSTRLLESSDTLGSVAAHRRVEPRTLGTLIRGELDWIVMKSLEKDRKRRYATANHLASDVSRYLSGLVIEAAPPSAVYKLTKFVRRNRAAVLAATVLAGTLVLGIVGTSIGLVRANAARAEERVQREEAQRNANKAEREAERASLAEKEATKRAVELGRVAEFQASQLKGVDPKLMGSRLRADLVANATRAVAGQGLDDEKRAELVTQLQQQLAGINFTSVALESLDKNVIEPSVAVIDRNFADQPDVQSRLLHAAGDTARRLGLTDRAFAVLARAMELRRHVSGEDHPETIELKCLVGFVLRRQGKLAEARSILDGAFESSKRTLGENHRQTLMAAQYLGDVANDLGKYAEAEKMFKDTLDRRRAALGENDEDVVQSLSNMGEVLYRQDRAEESEKYCREALALCQRLHGNEDIETLSKMNNLATALSRQKKHDEAVAIQRGALAGSRHTLGDNHPDVLTKLNNLGAMLAGQKKYDEAEPYLREAFEKLKLQLGPSHPTTLSAINNLAFMEYYRGRYDEAANVFAEGLRLSKADDPAVQEHRAVLMHHQAESLAKAGKPKESVAPATQAWGMYRAHNDWNPDEAHHAARVLSDALHAVHDDEAAIQALRELVEFDRKLQPPDDVWLANSLHQLGSALLSVHRAADAEGCLREVLAIRTRLYPDGHASAPVRYFTMSQLAGALIEQAEDQAVPQANGKALPAERRASLLREAEPLVLKAYAVLKADANNSSSAERAQQAAIRAASLYDLWSRIEPTAGYDVKAGEWRAK